MGCCLGDDKEDLEIWNVQSKRKCTDVFCLIIFILYVGAMGTLSAYAIFTGGAERLIYGMDSYGNICGQNNTKLNPDVNSGLDMTKRPNVFFFDFTAELSENFGQQEEGVPYSLEICVKTCPVNVLSAKDLLNEYRNGNNLCALNYHQKEINFDGDRILRTNTGKDGPCPNLPVPETKSIFNRCVPVAVGESGDELIKFVRTIPIISKITRDIYASRYTILYCSFASVGLSILFIFMLRYLASVVVWIIIVGVSLASMIATALMWYSYAISTGKVVNQIEQIEEVASALSSHEDILVFSIIVTVFSFFFIIFSIAAVSRAKLAAQLFVQAGKVIAKIPLILLQPLWMYICLIVIWSTWAFSVAFLVSSAEMHFKNGYVFVDKKSLWWAYLIQGFGIIWVTEVVIASHQFILSSAVSRYYFCKERSEFGQTSPLLESFLNLITYHMGSICFGSLLVALLRIPQAICGYLYHKSKNADSKIGQCLAKACMCCLCMFEKCLRYFNATSYTMVALTGHNYCVSACKGAATIASNAFRVGALAVVGGLTLFLGKILVGVLSGVCAGLMIRNFPDHPEVNSLTVPVVTCALIGYIISAGFFAVFSTAVNTLLLCFCEDCRINEGTAENPYFMPKGLMRFVVSADHDLSRGHLAEKSGESVPLRSMQ